MATKWKDKYSISPWHVILLVSMRVSHVRDYNQGTSTSVIMSLTNWLPGNYQKYTTLHFRPSQEYYGLFALRQPRSSLTINGKWGFLGVDRLYQFPDDTPHKTYYYVTGGHLPFLFINKFQHQYEIFKPLRWMQKVGVMKRSGTHHVAVWFGSLSFWYAQKM